MTNQEINERIAVITGFHDKVGLKKRGYWYRPDACGYTTKESEAGRYTNKEAKNHEYLIGEQPVTIHKFTTPNYAESLDACREFEESLSEDERHNYGLLIENTERFDTLWGGNRITAMVTVTAKERCEAFLRLKGKWE